MHSNMTFAKLAASTGYRKTSAKSVILIAVSASLLCFLHLTRLDHLSATFDPDSAAHSQPWYPSKSNDHTKDVYNRTLGVSYDAVPP